MRTVAGKVLAEVEKAFIGKEEITRAVLLAMIAGGHILLEDVPGVGKTTLAMAFSKALSMDYRRMQFTPDVMPSDVIGFTTFNRATNEFEYRPGPVMSHLFLADEINRTSSKTQSALLEAMEEGAVTVDGTTYVLPSPFTVIATQNPAGSAGTQLLPESQLDRFMIRLSIGYPKPMDEIGILKSRQTRNPIEDIAPAASAAQILAMREAAWNVFVADEILAYMVRIAHATRVSEALSLGISPRGTLALSKMARANAWLKGRKYVIPQDVTEVCRMTLAHRLVLTSRARVHGVTGESALADILAGVPEPKITMK
ncbi:MAG: MoxR family ATPase [Lachnospiraceae bacterium]|nr:MoxR family ATPase [Lachnospiraceae bacterium]